MAMTDDKQKAQILVAGCGKLGGDIATVLLGAGDVYGCAATRIESLRE